MTLEEKNAELEARLENAKIHYRKQAKQIHDLKAEVFRLSQKSLKPSPDMADRIYEEYPKKENRGSGIIAIQNAVESMAKNGNGAESLLEQAKAYARCLKRFGITSSHELWRFVPTATTWFTDERYNLSEPDWSQKFREGRYIEEKVEDPIEGSKAFQNQVRKRLKEDFPNANVDTVSWTYIKANLQDFVAMEKAGWIMKGDNYVNKTNG